ncbi:MAG: ATP-binding protein [Nitrospirota bacterium]
MIRSEKANYFDFLLDIVFISAMVYLSFGIYSYLTLLYLFPIFFGSVLIETKKTVLFPLSATVLYAATYYIGNMILERESILNILLHFLAFSLIALAGDYLKTRMENQERYIKRLEEERIKMQGYERLYRVSADLAHELRNPLASITAAAQFLKEGKSAADFVEMLCTETSRLNTLVNDFLLFSRPSDAPKESVNLSEVIKYAADLPDCGKKIIFDIQENAAITANRTFMEVAVRNVIKNSIEAAKSEIKVTLRSNPPLPPSARGGERRVAIDIEDDGAGVEEDMRDKIFEPFVTTKATGTGLGLAIAYRMITSFGGTIMVDKSALGGAKFSIMFPME